MSQKPTGDNNITISDFAYVFVDHPVLVGGFLTLAAIGPHDNRTYQVTDGWPRNPNGVKVHREYASDDELVRDLLEPLALASKTNKVQAERFMAFSTWYEMITEKDIAAMSARN